MAEHNHTGRTGEALARDYLEKKGFRIVATNFRHGKNEVDIIAGHKGVLHFFEVKTKAGTSAGLPEQRVNTAKINRMKNVAEAYLEQNPEWNSIQFDIISITMRNGLPAEIFVVEDIW